MHLHYVKKFSLVGLAVLCSASWGFVFAEPAAASTKAITTTDATAVCELYLGAVQTKTPEPDLQWVSGADRTIGDDCRSGNPDPNTVLAICKAHVAGVDTTFASGNPATSGSTFRLDTLQQGDVRERLGANVCDGGRNGLCTDGAIGANCVDTVRIASNSSSGQTSDQGEGFQPPPPGVDVSDIESLSSGMTFYALVACVVGICVSAALWAMGSRGQNPGTELTGKRGMIVCCSAAFFIGAVPTWINYLDDLASRDDPSGVTQVDVPIRRDG